MFITQKVGAATGRLRSHRRSWIAILAVSTLTAVAASADCPVVRTSIGDQEIDPLQTHDVFVWIERYSRSTNLPSTITLIFNNNRYVSTDKRELVLHIPASEARAGALTSGKREVIKVSFSKDARGLASLKGNVVTALPPECNNSFEQVINIGGFTGTAKLTTNLVQVDSTSGSRIPFTGGDVKTFTIFAKDNADQPFKLGATITFIVTAPPGALLSTGDGKWVSQLPVTGDGRRLADLQLKLPERSAEKNAKLTINGTLSGNNTQTSANSHPGSILDADILFDYEYIWWIRLLAIIGGAICYSLVDAADLKLHGKFEWASFGFKMFLLVLVGLLAFLVEDTKILGFAVDKTTIKGNILFGFLVGCLGLDGIINRVREFINAGKPSASGASGSAN